MKTRSARASRPARSTMIESLEDRCLLSASHGLVHAIPFSQAPALVQTALTALASADSLPAPTDTTTVFLGNARGIETYTVDLSTTSPPPAASVLTVDQNGNLVIKPVKTTATLADITNTAVTDEISAIVTALGLPTPDPTTPVTILTNADLTAVYTLKLSSGHGKSVSIDSAGNPVGDAKLPLSVFSAAIQNGLISNAPANSTPLAPTDIVSVKTNNGITTYSAKYQIIGTPTPPPVVVTVDNTGALAALPSTSTVKFADVPDATKIQLQTLANNNGYVGTIADTQAVTAYDEANGTIIYAVRLPVTGTGHSGATYTYMIVVAADQNGNPTVPPRNRHHGHDGCNGGDHGDSNNWTTDSDDDTPTTPAPGSTTPSTFSGFSKSTRSHGFRF